MNRVALRVVIVALLGVCGRFAAAAPSDDLAEMADDVIGEAATAASKKDWATCQIKASGVWHSQKDFRAAGLLGYCEAELGNFLDAAEHLQFYLANDNHKKPTRTRMLQEKLERVKREVGTLDVTCNEADARIVLDGNVLRAGPVTVFVAPGPHKLTAEKEGFSGTPIEVTLAKGERRPVALSITPLLVAPIPTGTASTQPPIGDGPPPAQEARPVWPAALGFGIAGAGLIVGGVLTGLSFARAADVEEAQASLGGRCSAQTPSDACQEGFDAAGAQYTFANGAAATFIASGAVAAASVGLLVWALNGPSESAAHPRIRVAPILGPDVQGLFLQLHY